MRYLLKLTALALSVVATMLHPATASPAPVTKHMTLDDVYHWLDTTDQANITFIGKHLDRNAPLAPDNVIVIYCSEVIDNTCGSGPCTMYNGPPVCLYAPDTNCLGAIGDVYFCSGNNCDVACNDYQACGDWLNGAYCYTPGTNSIFVMASPT
ncbi:hypothetical protein L226DRAFT_540221 [Lentinus tigrinus ALCF2SS1-7]|uniref:Uncharacterized protein n=1 Tax=Lentinus tigrinus ALCF2SS1-6 TaxID=1328759 RepID=A0A5C2S6T3_9APHY|nr:hypothetical protein L227DRAFT_612530 [Lentinus tigrinus ALCF2SS1-6]RPD68913.1 hypothetical protein L226DRAFT_540221 [Lentinus tigrinus ALCF2SS1-7]